MTGKIMENFIEETWLKEASNDSWWNSFSMQQSMFLEIFDSIQARADYCAVPAEGNLTKYVPTTFQELYECYFAWYLLNKAISLTSITGECDVLVPEFDWAVCSFHALIYLSAQ